MKFIITPSKDTGKSPFERRAKRQLIKKDIIQADDVKFLTGMQVYILFRYLNPGHIDYYYRNLSTSSKREDIEDRFEDDPIDFISKKEMYDFFMSRGEGLPRFPFGEVFIHI